MRNRLAMYCPGQWAGLLALMCGLVSCDSDGGEEAEQLSAGHPGYQQTSCFGCHTADNHNNGLRPGECAECHGANGAPAGHESEEDCLGCHATGDLAFNEDHAAADHVSPDDCNGCH